VRHSELVFVLVVPNVIAGLVTVYFLLTDFAQVIGIGTLAGVFYVAYSALVAPWVSGYLEDKRTHSTVLRERFFAASELLDTGSPGIWSNINPGSQTIWGGDEFRDHLPMEIRGRQTDTYADKKYVVFRRIDSMAAFPSAHSHMRAYPAILKAWNHAQTLKDRYNVRRLEILRPAVTVARARLAAEYAGFSEWNYDASAVPAGSFFVVPSVVMHSYFFAMSNELPGLTPPPVRAVPFINTNRSALGRNENAVELVAASAEDRSIPRLTALLYDIASTPSFAAGVRELYGLEREAGGAVSSLGELFEQLSTRIELGHRIEGTCPETGY
jgi:hypothetical protein